MSAKRIPSSPSAIRPIVSGLAPLLAIACLLACEAVPPEADDLELQAERWSQADDPAQAPVPLERLFSALPVEGSVHVTPWSGDSWGTVDDSLNRRWAGSSAPSPVEKYGTAFGLDGLPDVISALYGIDKYRANPPCTTDLQCAEGERCGRRTGASNAYCIPKWYGLCHAWSVASVGEPEPQHSVTLNGVNFEISDIKGLMTLAYDNSKLIFVSQRCDKSNALSEIELDENGRPGSECRDINPGALHVFLANYVGLRGETFAVDVVFDAPIGSMPVRSYRVLSQQDLSRQEAELQVGPVLSADAVRFVGIELTVDYIKSVDAIESNAPMATSGIPLITTEYSYVLEIDGAGAIIGGEWRGKSVSEHPDFLRLPVGPGNNPIATGFITYSRIKQILEASRDDASVQLVVETKAGQVQADHWQTFGPYIVGERGQIEASVTSPDNVELFIHQARTVSTQEYACRRRWAQTATPCVTSGPGSFYVSVLGQSWNSDFTVTVFYGSKK